MGMFICGNVRASVSDKSLAKTEALISLFLRESHDLLKIETPNMSLSEHGVSARVGFHYWTPGVPLALLYDVTEVPDFSDEDLNEIRRVYDMTKKDRIVFFMT
ncbi:hypothetical protein [Devriesea agamarum]|uniref:hypothetical protein n=1 Tax=Devriesea agamarum TaxID=472569 RepID=UPI00071D13DE|nr:hypothetical protein [Devriesea agamarum]